MLHAFSRNILPGVCPLAACIFEEDQEEIMHSGLVLLGSGFYATAREVKRWGHRPQRHSDRLYNYTYHRKISSAMVFDPTSLENVPILLRSLRMGAAKRFYAPFDKRPRRSLRRMELGRQLPGALMEAQRQSHVAPV